MRSSAGKKRRPVSRAVVLKDKGGLIIADPAEAVQAWEAHFFEEFGRNGAIVSISEARSAAALATRPTGVPGLSLEAWADRLLAVNTKSCCGRAAGRDGVVPEVLKYGGRPAARALAGVAVASGRDGIPFEYRGGLMTPVPRKPGMGPSLSNARGVILSPVPGKAYAKVLRREAAPLLLSHGAELQFGSR